MTTTDTPHFNGAEYKTEDDHKRLSKQHVRIRNVMLDGEWRTIKEISSLTKDPEPSVSAQLRHLRKERFGGYVVERRSRGNREKGLFEYRLLSPKGQLELMLGAEPKKKTCEHCKGKGYVNV